MAAPRLELMGAIVGLRFKQSLLTVLYPDSDVTEKNDEIANGVNRQKQNDNLLVQIKRKKRSAKTKVTKLRHELERLCVKDSEVTDIETLEDAQEILEELSAFYVEVGEDTGKNETFKKSETIEKDVQRAIEAGKNAIKVRSNPKLENYSRWLNERAR
ncbi:hypothetical protein pdam_00001469 [Pocillopora damicornis]|uniref:Uncharacterized protein n=1 Tax=Pocillopora damicornis TaxID=46731 RepID=A0A3M6V3I2_POCDA|nr:hypothetical protein pdam_00001469 [Pocillopora damicornis]